MENHKTDDRMEDLMQKVREGRGTDAACMLDYCTQIEEYAERAGDARLLGFSHYYKGRTYYLSNETGKVFEEIGEALGYLEQSGSGNWWQPPTILWRLYPSARATCRLQSSTIWQD